MAARRRTVSVDLFMAMALSFLWSERGETAPFKATDIFKSPCAPIQNPVYKLWSSGDTWPNRIVPGMDDSLSDVTIPCGVAVQLDVKNISVGTLTIKGLLSVRDSASLGNLYVKAMHILVEGKLSIGTFEQQFSQKITFELTASPYRVPLQFSSFLPADPSNPRSLGHKTFAVVGGQVDLHGMPGGKDTPSWCQLAATALPGATSIIVDNPLAIQWPIGGLIAIAVTDYEFIQSERRAIQTVASTADGKVRITFSEPLLYMHNGVNVSDGMGGWVDERGEVALLSRNIIITGTDEPSPYIYYGGHFVIYQTPDPPQFIEGVEFFKMGQQGCVGRYPVYFYLIGDSPNTVVRRNSIHQSKQRCIVVTASHDITFKENVAFNVSGDCYTLEEGGGQNNTYDSNIGITTLPALSPQGSDQSPSMFRITAPSNIFINNRAVGAFLNGFTWDVAPSVGAMSKGIPSLSGLSPISTPITKFKGNVAHSCHNVGMQTSPDFRPGGPDGTLTSFLEDILIYKQSSKGLTLTQAKYLSVSGTFADCGVGVLLLESRAIQLTNSRFVGLTTNYGTPERCYATDVRGWYLDCAPADGTCRMPLSPNAVGRTHSGWLTDPIYGIQISQERRINGHTAPCRISNIKFALFNYTCSKPGISAAIIPVRAAINGSSFNPHFNFQGLQFFTNTLPIYFPPRIGYIDPRNITSDNGEVSQYFVMEDVDGSIIGAPGALVANNSFLIPPTNCRFFPEYNAYGCPGACYRTVRLEYPEPGFQTSDKSVNKRGDWSSLRITRLRDGKSVVMDGNLNDPTSTASYPIRVYFLILLVGQAYDIAVVPPPANLSYYPTSIKFGYHDDVAACSSSVRLRFKPPSTTGFQWRINETDSSQFIFRTCNGAIPEGFLSPSAQYVYTCVRTLPYLDVELPPYFLKIIRIDSVVGNQNCKNEMTCNVATELKSDWLWDASGIDRRPTFFDPSASASDLSYMNTNGTAVFGYNNIPKGLNTTLPKSSQTRISYVFRRTFPLKDAPCFSSLTFQLFFENGILVFLNGKEVIRSNLPYGKITALTPAVFKSAAWMQWQEFKVDVPAPNNTYGLVEGINTVAAEVHVWDKGAQRMLFDMRIFGTRKSRC